MSRRTDRQSVFEAEFREDLKYWVTNDRKTALRLLTLVEDTMRSPFEGLGKPEPLRFALSGLWSRRLTGEHRMVYRVFDERIEFMAARFHYGD